MAKIDALLQHMTQNGATRAVLNADAPAILESAAGAQRGKPLAGAQIEAMLGEIMPADANQNLRNSGRADFAYSAPSGDFHLTATQPNGQWQLEIVPAEVAASNAQTGDVAAFAADNSTEINIVPVAPVAPEVELAKKPGPPRFDPSASVAPPTSPPDAATPPGGYAPAGYPPANVNNGGNAYNNDSGMGDASVLPAELHGFNWGALFGSWIWGLGNSVWIGLLGLVPCVGFFMRFYLGAKGNEMAWKSKRWDSVQSFRSAQTTWAIVGIALIGVTLFMGLIMSAILFPVFARARENARRSACQQNLKQLSLAALQFSQAHNDKLPVGTTMAQWKPQLQPYLGNTSDKLFVCPSHQGAGESYEVNPNLSGVALDKIASPWETPMFYEPESALHLDGSSVAFADGHVKWYREDKAKALAPK